MRQSDAGQMLAQCRDDAFSRTLKTEILAKTDTVLKGAEGRYAAGDISLTDILPVRRDWAAIQLTYLESLRDVMHAWAEIKPLAQR
jgi:outer membrane protein TolC